MRTVNEILTTFDNGDHVNDEELKYVILVLEGLEASLRLAALPEYRLVLSDVRWRLETYRGYEHARGLS
jgi:hypothetical protein